MLQVRPIILRLSICVAGAHDVSLAEPQFEATELGEDMVSSVVPILQMIMDK